MYEPHYGLNKKPFQITTDPASFWMGTKYRDALASIKYGVMDNKGCLLLTGGAGTGKTTLINRLIEDIKDEVYTAKIADPRLTKYDFYRMVSRYFKLPIEVRTKDDFLEPFSRFLGDAYHEKKSVLLLIDEAQRLKHDLMEEIRYLSNLEHNGVKLINILFVGQNEFKRVLQQPENLALMRRITTAVSLDRLSQEEAEAYIKHRLRVSGADYGIFTKGAVGEIYDFSNGSPRQINIICDLAMFFASQLNQRTIGRNVIEQCRKRISFDTPKTQNSPIKETIAFPSFQEPISEETVPGVRSSSRRLYVGIGIVTLLLLAGGVGAYFSAPRLKTVRFQLVQQVRQWLGQKTETPEAPSLQKEVGDASAVHSGAPVASNNSDSKVEDSIASPQDLNSEKGEAAPMPTEAPSSVASKPDPADAVDFVLNKRGMLSQP